MKNQKSIYILKIIVGILLLYIVYRRVSQKEIIFDAFQEAHWFNIFLCIIFLIPNYLMQFLKWRYMLKKYDPNINNLLVLKSLLFGSTLGFITPGNLGELARAIYFSKYNRFVLTGLNIIDKLFGIIIFFIFGVISINVIIASDLIEIGSIKYLVYIVSFIIVMSVLVFTFNPNFVRNKISPFLSRISYFKSSRTLTKGLENFTRRDSVQMFFYSFIWYVVIIIQYHLLISAFTNVSFLHSIIAVSAVLVTKQFLPISFGDLGIREGAAIFYFSKYHVAKAAAFNASLLIFVINFFIPAMIGSYFVFKLKWNYDKR